MKQTEINNQWSELIEVLKSSDTPKPFTPAQLAKIQKWHKATPAQRKRFKREPRKYIYSKDPKTLEEKYTPIPSGFYSSLANHLDKWLSTPPVSRKHDFPFSEKQLIYVRKVTPDNLAHLFKLSDRIYQCSDCGLKVNACSRASITCHSCEIELTDISTEQFQAETQKEIERIDSLTDKEYWIHQVKTRAITDPKRINEIAAQYGFMPETLNPEISTKKEVITLDDNLILEELIS